MVAPGPGMLRPMGIAAAATVDEASQRSSRPRRHGLPPIAPALAAYGRRRTTGGANNLWLSHLRDRELMVTILSREA
jgi:hypothetical protein